MAAESLVLCECCALKLANDDESGCRDFWGHDHAPLEVPADTVLSHDAMTWDSDRARACDGHVSGVIRTGDTYWVAERLN